MRRGAWRVRFGLVGPACDRRGQGRTMLRVASMEEETSTLQSRAQHLLRKRVDAIGDLETALDRLTEAKAAVADAERQMSEAMKGATNAGWTTNELRELGLPVAKPSRPSSRVSRAAQPRAGRSNAPSASAAAQPASETSSPAS